MSNYDANKPADNPQLKARKTMDPYRTYISNQDEAQKAFQELYKKDEFRNYVDVRPFDHDTVRS